MKNSMFPILMTLIVILGFACADPKLEGALYIPPGGWELKIPDSDARPPAPAECTEPRPPRQGCTQVCKPCLIFVCVNGEWTRTQLPWPPGLCGGRRLPQGTPVNVCPRTSTGWCPPECDWCF